MIRRLLVTCLEQRIRRSFLLCVCGVLLSGNAFSQSRTQRALHAAQSNDRAIFNKLAGVPASEFGDTEKLATRLASFDVRLMRNEKVSVEKRHFLQLTAQDASPGDVVLIQLPGANPFRMIYMGTDKFPSTIGLSERAFYVYGWRGGLTYNTFPPRKTRRAISGIFNAKNKYLHPTVITALFSWADSKGESWVVWPKNESKFRNFDPYGDIAKSVFNGDFRVHRQGASSDSKLESFALAKMDELHENRAQYIGSRLYASSPASYGGRQQTNCFTFVKDVLTDAFEKTNNKKGLELLQKYGTYNSAGTLFAEHLVRELKWTAYFWSPDVKNTTQLLGSTPTIWGKRDGSAEHIANYQNVKSGKGYQAYGKGDKAYTIPVPSSNLVVNYHLTGDPSPNSTPFANVKFGYGLTLGGYHHFLIRNGRICEVHWWGDGNSKEQSDLYHYGQKFAGWNYAHRGPVPERGTVAGNVLAVLYKKRATYQSGAILLKQTQITRGQLSSALKSLWTRELIICEEDDEINLNSSAGLNRLINFHWKPRTMFLSGIVLVPPKQ